MDNFWIFRKCHGWRGHSKIALIFQTYFTFVFISGHKEIKCWKFTPKIWNTVSFTSPRAFLNENFKRDGNPIWKAYPCGSRLEREVLSRAHESAMKRMLGGRWGEACSFTGSWNQSPVQRDTWLLIRRYVSCEFRCFC